MYYNLDNEARSQQVNYKLGELFKNKIPLFQTKTSSPQKGNSLQVENNRGR